MQYETNKPKKDASWHHVELIIEENLFTSRSTTLRFEGALHQLLVGWSELAEFQPEWLDKYPADQALEMFILVWSSEYTLRLKNFHAWYVWLLYVRCRFFQCEKRAKIK